LQLPGDVWHATGRRGSLRGEHRRVLALDGDGRRLDPQPLTLPAEWIDRFPAAAILGVTVTFSDLGSGHALLFDSPVRSTSALRFAQRLAKLLAPAICGMYMLRRLRSRIGAIERGRVARELHDGVIQSLIGLQMQVDALRRSPRDAAVLAANLGRIQELLAQDVHDLRDLMHQLEPVDFRPRELLAYTQEIVDRFQRETGISARFISDVEEVTLSPLVCHELARITREALVNVRKHSGARNVLVRFTSSADEHQLVIENDGCAFDFEGRWSQIDLDSTHRGPAVIKARVRAIGGKLTIDSSSGSGVRLQIAIPRTIVQRRTA
jgi:signal transduction histidine kinase